MNTILGQTEWPNRTKSDVMYLPNSKNLPPILLEIQYTVDSDFLLRLISYSVSAIRLHNTLPPIILIFAVSSIKYEVKKWITINKDHHFLLQYPCQPWTQRCYFVSNDSITSSLKRPLDPFVALSMFLTSQHTSLLTNPYRDDTTVQQLYAIAKRIFQDQVSKHEDIYDDLNDLCGATKTFMEQALLILGQDGVNLQAKSQLESICQDMFLKADVYEKKNTQGHQNHRQQLPQSHKPVNYYLCMCPYLNKSNMIPHQATVTETMSIPFLQ